MNRRPAQRGVAMVEFALVAGLFFLLVTTLFDVGKGVYVKNTLDAAAREGARAGVVLTGASGGQPTLTDMENAIKAHSSDVAFATPCPFATPTTTGLANNKGAIYITSHNLPGGGAGSVDLSGCAPLGIAIPAAASGNQKITVVIMYKYTPITPLVAQFTGSLTFESTSTYTTEY
jgi:Flp pilus assembly protein TadG